MNHLDGEALNFEYERKFFIDALPADVATHAEVQTIVQAYLFAEEGYAVRVRITFPGAAYPMPPFFEDVDYLGSYERRALANLLDEGGSAPHATIAVKSPSIGGERYELEQDMDIDVAHQILRRSSNIVLKNRYSLWLDEDGWEFDVFGGQNAGLVLAEIERLGPVVDLRIPDFALTEVTDDLRFTNDYLSKEPWKQWGEAYRAEFAARGPHFMDLRNPESRGGEGALGGEGPLGGDDPARG